MYKYLRCFKTQIVYVDFFRAHENTSERCTPHLKKKREKKLNFKDVYRRRVALIFLQQNVKA